MGNTGKRAVWIVGAIAVTVASGLAGGVFLERYDEERGFQREADLIAQVLELRPGMEVGDVRAGTGKWTADIARRVGEAGQVYATAGPNPPHIIFQTVAQAELDNVTVITRTPGNSSRLPEACCDAVLVRAVYHEFENRPVIIPNLFSNLRPGGRLAVIDFDEGTPEHLSGHGISRISVINEMSEAGFEVERVIDDWAGNAYCVVFRKPGGPAGRSEAEARRRAPPRAW